jgi:hypothetical protein
MKARVSETTARSAVPLRLLPVKPVFHFARIVPKRAGEHAQIEKRFINPLPGVFAYQNEKFVKTTCPFSQPRSNFCFPVMILFYLLIIKLKYFENCADA